MYAVIKTGGKQYKVAPGEILSVEKVTGEAGDQVVFEEVLLVGNDDGVTLGDPLVGGAGVAADIVEQGRGRKIKIFKKKRRQGYRRTAGHRQHLTRVKITEILTDGKKPSKAAKPAAKKADDKDKTAAAGAKADAGEAKAEAKAEAKSEAKAETKAAPKSGGDDLKKISGVGPALEKKLHGLGVTSFQQIVEWTADDIARIDEELNFKGRIERDDWQAQAKALMAENG